MLWKILHEIEAAQGPLDLNELSRRLDVDRSVLDGMIQFWVRKGRLVDDASVAGQATTVCASHTCGRNCPSSPACPFTMKLPRTISLIPLDAD
ncbi:MAG: FeoC-like transcriptional regulator [Caldilinea sp.]|uniref:FeoC-like transcriptional regulator n=1 Tax=Caldilinea sp. TaxID=2293560 RepID=UPI002B73C6E7|nr:hypothetical protein [Anaerolineales bacterium]HQY90066.1 FeoC-like transcriptional regulator [Caldilinea sp.]HRA65651.1 FeoC-like transcriptional regulator [Caldilinea sp.]